VSGDEAARLVNRIVSTWPTGPKGHIWTEVVLELDATLADQAYRRLRAEHERAPAVATYLAAYKALRAERRRQADAHHVEAALDPDELIPLSEYLRRLTARAEAGDTDAADDLSRWRRYLKEPWP
jgi:hypothetical protein